MTIDGATLLQADVATLPTTAMLVVTMLQHVLILYLTSSPPTVLVYFRFYYFMPIAFCFNIQVYKVYVAL